jgi:hypothetical protein
MAADVNRRPPRNDGKSLDNPDTRAVRFFTFFKEQSSRKKECKKGVPPLPRRKTMSYFNVESLMA